MRQISDRSLRMACSHRSSMNLSNLSLHLTRRTFLGRAAAGLGSLALGSLLNPQLLRRGARSPDRWRGVVNPLHHPAKIKRVIYLYLAGGPSHLETFDFKPKLKADARQADAGVVHEGPADRAAAGQGAEVLRRRSSSFNATESRARKSARCSRTSAASRTTSASSARCTPSRSITIRRTRS